MRVLLVRRGVQEAFLSLGRAMIAGRSAGPHVEECPSVHRHGAVRKSRALVPAPGVKLRRRPYATALVATYAAMVLPDAHKVIAAWGSRALEVSGSLGLVFAGSWLARKASDAPDEPPV